MVVFFAFDCGTVNLGFAAIETVTVQEYKEINKNLINLAKSIYATENISLPKKQWLEYVKSVLLQIHAQLNTIVKLKFVNTFQLIPHLDSQTKSFSMIRLSDVLNTITHMLGIPDYVLVEKQMSINTTAMDIVGGIEMFFANLKTNQKQEIHQLPAIIPEEIHVAFNYWEMSWVKPRNNIKFVVVAASLKNTIALGGNELGTFIAKYSTNYTANKNHADANFQHFLEVFGPHDLLLSKRKKQKTNDAADAFMMAIAYLRKYMTEN